MSKRLVVIDGKSVFYRGYYAMPNLSTKDGRATGGVYGFATMALEVVKKLEPDYVCVAWDKRHTNIRSRLELYPQYKAGRKPAPEDFYDQVELLLELLDSLGWPLYELDDYEADDIMATFATQAKAKNIETFLVTSDLDVLQLVNSHTHIYTLKKGLSSIELFNQASFEEKYGVGAHQWVDVKALKGDASDNIPGVGGIGEKTALELIDKYGSLEGVYEHLDLLKPALRDKLERDKDMAFLSKKLVTLFTDAPVKLDFERAKKQDGVSPEFVACLRKLEFRTLLAQAEKAMTEEQLAEVAVPADKLEPAKKVDFNLTDYPKDKPRVVAFNPENLELWVSAKSGEYSTLPHSKDAPWKWGKDDVVGILDGPLIGHDLKTLFRACLAVEAGCAGTVLHDTRVGAFLLNSLERSRELTDLLDQPVDVTEPGEVIAAIWKAYEDQRAQFDNLEAIDKLAREIEFPSIWLLAKVEHRGILLDVPYLEDMSQEFASKIGVIERRIFAQAGQEFNILSPIQLAMILYEKLGLPTAGIKKGKTGYSTGALELAKLQPLHPIIDQIVEYREYTKLKSTYIDSLPKLVDKDNRLHTTFALDISASGRLSSHDPNLQNIPTRTDIGHAIRRAFIPAKGNVFVGADYSQFELRLAAAMAGDQQLIDDFNQDIDIHTKTAAEVYGVKMEEVTKTQRRNAKTINFAVLYGMSPHGLANTTGMSFSDAKDFIDKYFELRKPIRQFIDRTLEEARERGYVETIFGRRRPTPDLKSSNFMVREAAKRQAANMPIQGTEADLMKLAMLKLEDELDGLGQQILQIHDSILVETPKKNAEKVAKLLKDTMENIYKLPVNLKVDTKTGHNWGEL
jgi:DNA polymerase I